MDSLKILWQFSRPHTIIGSTLSILAIFAIAVGTSTYDYIPTLVLPLSLISAIACNIYITGLNQWSDVEVDKINKPWLPIAAGTLSKKKALRIVLVCGFISLLSAVLLSFPFFLLILFIMSIGTAYSLPPLKLKKNYVAAAAAISVVRGLLVNIGFYLHFRHELTGSWSFTTAIIPLTIFVTAFSIGIALFKDIPDTEGDAEYKFGTLAVKNGRRSAFLIGVAVVSFAYLYIIFAALVGQLPSKWFYVFTQLAALVFFLYQSRQLNVGDDKQVKRFYMIFWGLFFIEYIVYPLGFYL